MILTQLHSTSLYFSHCLMANSFAFKNYCNSVILYSTSKWINSENIIKRTEQSTLSTKMKNSCNGLTSYTEKKRRITCHRIHIQASPLGGISFSQWTDLELSITIEYLTPKKCQLKPLNRKQR